MEKPEKIDQGFLNSETSPAPSATDILSDKLDEDPASLEDTDVYDKVDLQLSTDIAPASEEEHQGSIMDLLGAKKAPEVSMADTDEDLSEQITDKTLDEILKTPVKEDEEWHISTHESIDVIKKRQAKQRRLIKILIVCIVLIFSAAIVLHIVKMTTATPPPEVKAVKISYEKLVIAPTLKDSGKLSRFLALAESLYRKKQYRDALIVLKKILKTGWNPGLVNGMLGACKAGLNDKKSARMYYEKSVKSGYMDKPDFALSLAGILEKDKAYEDIVKVLEPFGKKFPSNQAILQYLAVAYYKTGESDKLLQCYSNINPSLLPEDQLSNYGAMLLKQGDRKKAFKVYLSLGKVYNNMAAYEKAEELAPDQETKVSILARLASKTKDKSKKAHYSMLLAVYMIESGKINEGVQIIKGLNTDMLDKKSVPVYLSLIPYFDGTPVLMQEAVDLLRKYYPKDMEMHSKVLKRMRDAGKNKMSEEFFRRELRESPDNEIVAFMYAESLSDLVKKKEFYLKAIKLSPRFYEALFALGKLYMSEQKWRDANKFLSQCLSLKPYSKELKYRIAVTRIHLTGSGKSLKEYEGYLRSRKLAEPEILKQMVLLAQHMKKEHYVSVYLKQAARLPELKHFCQIQTARSKLIYHTAEEKDFKGFSDDPVLRKYYVIYLLGKGRLHDIMLLPVKREDFPDFWKVFICWRQEIPSWKQNSYRLLAKHKDEILIPAVVNLWLKNISPEKAALLLQQIDYEDKPLLCLMIALQYRKSKKNLKSTFFFRKALTYARPNIYVDVVKFLRKKQ